MSLFFTFGLHSSDVVVFWNIKLKKLVLFEAQIIILKLCHFVECISKTEYNAKSLIEPHYLTCINKNHGSNSPFSSFFVFYPNKNLKASSTLLASTILIFKFSVDMPFRLFAGIIIYSNPNFSASDILCSSLVT